MKLEFKNLYTVMAREVTTDAADNMTSIIKMIEKFTFGYNPDELKAKGATIGKDVILFGAKYAVATSWHLGEHLTKDEIITFRISVLDSAGNNRGGPAQEHMLPAGIDRVNMNFSVDGLPVLKAGNYKLIAEAVSKTGDVLGAGEYPFVVELLEEKLSGQQ